MADPLKNDGAAFRLLVAKALNLDVDPEGKRATAVGWGGIVCSEPFADKAGALPAARRAVVNAAAEVDRRYGTRGVPLRDGNTPPPSHAPASSSETGQQENDHGR